MRSTHRGLLVAWCIAAALLAMPGAALAYDETGNTTGSIGEPYCGQCHDPWASFNFAMAGVHGNYTTTTSKCEECHTVHKAPAAGVLLLPAATIKATCFTCHDGTQGKGVYGAVTARGIVVGAKHSVESTSVVPGGSAATGGSATETFRGSGGTMTCTDCHSVHGSNIVAAYQGERNRSGSWSPAVTPKLLRQRPGDSTVSVSVYGSDWCLACHRGRSSALSTVHNHPADSNASTATPFTYSNVALLASDVATSVTTTGTLGKTNRGYLMPYPRTPQQRGHSPICQQCHEDSRSPGVLVSDGSIGDATTYTVGLDGTPWTANPAFQNFPHETPNYRFLVEATTTAYTDDLCLNCHPMAQLP